MYTIIKKGRYKEIHVQVSRIVYKFYTFNLKSSTHEELRNRHLLF